MDKWFVVQIPLTGAGRADGPNASMMDVLSRWPRTLKSYVASDLKSWFESADDDKCPHQDGSYFLGEEDLQKQGEIIIMDRDADVKQRFNYGSS